MLSMVGKLPVSHLVRNHVMLRKMCKSKVAGAVFTSSDDMWQG